MNISDNFCLILAGGKGKRLWPFSKEALPKQFLDLFGTGKTALQQTFERMVKIIPVENIFISTNEAYLDIVREQLPQVSPSNILAEPVQRSSAPSTAWASLRIGDRKENANIIITPADMMILKEEEFLKDMTDGLEFVNGTDKLLSVGIKATTPETEYGYIQTDGETPMPNIFRVKSFTEKPELEFAKMFIDSGDFFWNTGIFISTVTGIRKAIDLVLPVIFRNIRKEQPGLTVEEEDEFIKAHFSQHPNVSLEHGVLEKSDEVFVLTCNFGWADMGTWHNVYEQLPKNEKQNVILNSQVITDDCHNSFIKTGKGKLTIVNGLDDYLVIDDNDVLLICRKEDSSALVRKYVNEAQIKYNDTYL